MRGAGSPHAFYVYGGESKTGSEAKFHLLIKPIGDQEELWRRIKSKMDAAKGFPKFTYPPHFHSTDNRKNILLLGPRHAGKSSLVNTLNCYLGSNDEVMVARTGATFGEGTKNYAGFKMEHEGRSVYVNDMPGVNLHRDNVENQFTEVLKPLLDGMYVFATMT